MKLSLDYSAVIHRLSGVLGVLTGFLAVYVYLQETDPGNLFVACIIFFVGFIFGQMMSMLMLAILPAILIIFGVVIVGGALVMLLRSIPV